MEHSSSGSISLKRAILGFLQAKEAEALSPRTAHRLRATPPRVVAARRLCPDRQSLQPRPVIQPARRGHKARRHGEIRIIVVRDPRA